MNLEFVLHGCNPGVDVWSGSCSEVYCERIADVSVLLHLVVCDACKECEEVEVACRRFSSARNLVVCLAKCCSKVARSLV